MKNVIRAFAVALVITGAVASAEAVSAKNAKPVVTTLSASPVPVCAPNTGGCDMY